MSRIDTSDIVVSVVPLPPALWLFASALFAFVVVARRKK
jgi:hypothetical protein